MIKNERQLKITRTQAGDFRMALLELENKQPGDSPNIELRWAIQRDSLKSQLEDLEREIDSYLALQDQVHVPMELTLLEELPTALVKARIAAGLHSASSHRS